ncbi:MAG: alcohol dehydrogenase catalytic domain-containing protein [Cyanobacteriota bacterium]
MRALTFDSKIKFKTVYPITKRENEALIKIKMAGICNTDLELVKGYMGFKGVLGHEFVGIVEKSINKTLIGKRVCGEINCSCGECYYCKNNLSNHCPNRSVLGIFNRDGIFCDYTYLPENNLHIIPDNVSDEEAVFVEPLAAAFRIVEQIDIKNDYKIIVLGDGKLGLLIAKVLSLYSNNVLAVGKHKNKLSLLENSNIETILVNNISDIKADIVVDASGRPEGLQMAMNLVRPAGYLILKTTVADKINMETSKIVIDEINIIGSRCGPFKPAIEALSLNKVDVKPLINKIYDFDNAEEAFKHAQKSGVLKILLKF